jgi:hypothetical protein
MEAAGSFETLVTTYMTTWCRISEDHSPNFHRRENLSSGLRTSVYAIKFCFSIRVTVGPSFVADYLA